MLGGKGIASHIHGFTLLLLPLTPLPPHVFGVSCYRESTGRWQLSPRGKQGHGVLGVISGFSAIG